MDHRKHLHIPENFAYIIRSGGANLRYSEFKVSYAIAIGKVKHLALIGHNHCGMVALHKRKKAFIQGLVDRAGWNAEAALEHFTRYAPLFETGNEVDFILSETRRLRLQYPKITIVPMMYLVEDNRIYLINEDYPEDPHLFTSKISPP
jgi:carbonic anhydrase